MEHLLEQLSILVFQVLDRLDHDIKLDVCALDRDLSDAFLDGGEAELLGQG